MNNPFLTKKDSLVEAVQSAMQDGELSRQAEALVNEEFGVYSRKAVVREQLAAYDARLEEAYKCMKEGEKKDEPKLDMMKREQAKKDYSKMRERMVGKGKDLETTRKIVGEAKKLADKDYDKDGKIESPKDEVWGSRFRAAKMAGKMEEEQIDEISTEKLIRYRNKAGEDREKGAKLAYAKLTGKAKVPATMPKHSYMEEEQIDEISRHTLMSYRNKAAKQVMDIKKKGWSTEKDRDTVQKREIGHSLAGDKMRVRVAASYNKGYSPEDLAKHGGRGGATPRKVDEEQIDEVSAGLARRASHHAFVKSDKMKADAKKEPDMHSYVQAVHKGEKKSKQGTKFAKYAAKKMEEEQIDEISKELTRRYKDKAHASYNYSAGKRSDDEFVSGPGKGMTDVFGKLKFKERSKEAQKTDDKTIQKRLKGLSMAHKKLAKEESIDEAAYSAKAARAGKDIGKPGKMFSKIAKKAGERYGSEERGKKVAGAILKRIRAKHMREEQIDEIVTQAQLKSSGLSLRDYMNREKGLTRRDSSTPAAKTSTPQGAPGLKGPSGDSFSKTAMQSTQRWADPGSRDYSKSNQGTMKTPTPAPAASTSAPEKTSWHAPMVRPPQELASKTADVNTGAPKVAQGAPMPSATASAPKNKEAGALPKTMAESVQVGDNKYRIV